jgi:hypothetical protein
VDGFTIYMRLSEAWRSAAREAGNATLKACYTDRAARYLVLALGEEPGSIRKPSAPANRGGDVSE